MGKKSADAAQAVSQPKKLAPDDVIESTEINRLYGPVSRGLRGLARDFILLYDGNAKAAALAAGVGKNSGPRMGQEIAEFLCRKKVREAIAEKCEFMDRVADSKERRQFWTRVMNDRGTKMADRLKASELLGKADGDFGDDSKRGNLAIVFIGSKNMVSIGGNAGKQIEAVCNVIECSAEQAGEEIQSS